MTETVLPIHLPDLPTAAVPMSKPPSRNTAPFAVIELIAIVAILGILVVIALPSLTKARTGNAPTPSTERP